LRILVVSFAITVVVNKVTAGFNLGRIYIRVIVYTVPAFACSIRLRWSAKAPSIARNPKAILVIVPIKHGAVNCLLVRKAIAVVIY
jgi:hypothetical protein